MANPVIPQTPLYRYILLFVWIIFPAGVLWEYLGWFTLLREYSAGPLITGIAAMGIWILSINGSPQQQKQLLALCLLVFALGMGAEIAGVHTGLIFGGYLYGDRLGPTLAGVPLAIGSAWVMMALFSHASLHKFPVMFRIPGAALLATAFDALMEPAAVKLDYWQWEQGSIPVQNFIAWFVFSLAFTALLSLSPLSRKNPEGMLTHLLLVQVVYFVLVLTVLP